MEEKTVQEKMPNQEIMELIDYRVNQKLTQMKAELREESAHFNQQTASANNDWEGFRKQSEYIQLLIQVQSAEHNVHKEIDEAILKIKELTYA